MELDVLKEKINNYNGGINDTIMPLLDSLSQDLSMGILNQKEENNSYQDQLTELKKEKCIMSQMIAATSKRSDMLLEEVGQY